MTSWTTTSFEAKKDGGKPMIFWEQQAFAAQQKKNTRKAEVDQGTAPDYKGKDQKFALRSKKKPAEPVIENKKAPTKPTNVGTQNAAARAARRNNQPHAAGIPSKGNKKSNLEAGTVTLTEKQLDAILETIGQLTLENEDLKKGELKSVQNGQAANSPGDKKAADAGDEEHIFRLADPTRHLPPSRGPAASSIAVPSPLPPSEVGDAGLEQKGLQSTPSPRSKHPQNQDTHKTVEATGTLPGMGTNKPEQQRPEEPTRPVVPKAHMTKAELKRLEWEREKEEMKKLQDAQKALQHSHTANSNKVEPEYVPGLGAVGTTQQQQQPAVTHKPPLSKIEQKKLEWEKERQEINQGSTKVEKASDDSAKVEPSFVPGLGNVQNSHTNEQQAPVHKPPLSKLELKKLQWEKERQEMERQQQVPVAPPHHHQQNQQQPQQSTAGPTMVPKTKAELKKQQWEQERAANAQGYDPWGKPGAGAPVKDSQGNLLADYASRKGTEANSPQPRADSQALNTAIHNDKPMPAWNNEENEYVSRKVSPAQPGQGTHPSGAGSTATQPSAIRSSFTVGQVAPDAEKFTNTKEQQKKQWLADLEKQREEQRLKKQQEKEKARQAEIQDTWADRMTGYGYKQSGLPPQHPAAMATTADDVDGQAANQLAPRTNSAPQPSTSNLELVSPRDPLMDSGGFLRGQNVAVDPVTKVELEEKRRRAQEHQDAIKAQVEERQRLKQLQKEQQMREEAIEEERLRKEREALQNQYEIEQRKAKEKEELQRQRVDLLKEAMDRAQEEAQREKHERRLRKLQQGGHDISHLHASFEAKMSPRVAPGNPPPAQVVHVEPTYVPGLHPTPRDVAGQQQQPAPPQHVVNEPYTENRVLTPSIYRKGPNTEPTSPRREFGTQTEFKGSRLPRQDTEDSVDIVYKGPLKQTAKEGKLKEGKSTKKVRVKSAPSVKEKEQQKKPVKISERPRWGCPNPSKKKAVKQSERDPNYLKQKERIEAKRAQRQQELLEMAERNTMRVAQRTTAASRARSRSPDHGESHEHDGRNRSRSPSKRAQSRSDSSFRGTARSRSPPAQAAAIPPSPLPNNLDHSHGNRSHRSRLDSYRSGSEAPKWEDYNEFARTTSPPVPSLGNKSESPPPYQRRTKSPPIPAIRHRLENDYKMDAHNYDEVDGQSTRNTKYGDSTPVSAPVQNGDFVPFIRSMNILDPAHAEDPLPVSREATGVERARMAYMQGKQPGSYGTKMENYEDTRAQEEMPAKWNKDPIMNPQLVTGHPTPRQDRILQHLSDLRRGLMQKQRELEVGLTPAVPLMTQQEVE